MKNRYTIALLSMIMVCLLSAPATAGYAYGGFNVNTMTNGTVQGDVFASYGSNGGLASSPYTTSYNVPAGTVKWARLYVGVWGGNEANTGWVNTTLNGNSLGSVTLGGTGDTNPTYSSGTNAYSSGNGVWMVSYNCTDNVISGSNIAIATTGGSIDGRIYGIVLVVVYENTSLPNVQYWVNEGNPNLNYVTPLNNNVSWFNGTAYTSTEANLIALYYTGTNGEHDYLYLNAPYASDSPYNLSNIGWNISKYRRYQLDSNDVANSYSGLISTSYFDFDSFTSSNDSTALKDIINTTAANSNYAIFWRGHDDDGNGQIDSTWNASGIEGETYVHPILAVLRLKSITHVYDFSIGAGVDKWAFRPETSATLSVNIPNTEFTATQYTNISADDGTYQKDSSLINYAAHRFNFSISESAPEKINVIWNGMGWHDSGGTANNGTYLYIYNFTLGNYEELANNSGDGNEVYLTGEKTSGISNYINTNVTVLVKQKITGDGDSYY